VQDSKLAQRVAQRYAEALIDLGRQENSLDRFGADLDLVEAVLTRNRSFRDLLASPVIKILPKKAVLQQAFGADLHPFTMNFINLLVDRRRSMFLVEVCQAFRRLLLDLKKTALAEVTSAVALTPAQEAQLKARLIILTKSTDIQLQTRIDPELLGGLVVKFGDQIIDVSLRGQLRRLALQLSLAT